MSSKVRLFSDLQGCIHDLEMYYQNLKTKISQKEKSLSSSTAKPVQSNSLGNKQLVPLIQDPQEGSEATIVQLRLDAVHDLLLKIKHLHPGERTGSQSPQAVNRTTKTSQILPDQYLDFLNYVPNLPLNFPNFEKIQDSNNTHDDLSDDDVRYGKGSTDRQSSIRTATDRSVGTQSMNSITCLINNFLEFIKTRCEIVYVEYDEYHQLLQDLVQLSQRDSRLKARLDQIFQRGKEDLCGKLFDGEEILRAFRGVVLKGVSDLSNLVDRRISERRQILLFRRKEIEELHSEYSRIL